MRLRAVNTYDSRDSLEGLPDPLEIPGMPACGVGSNLVAILRRSSHLGLAWLGERAPGLLLAVALAWLATMAAGGLNRAVGILRHINAIPLAILLGLLVCNFAGVPEVFRKGLRICMVQLLRAAIVLLGLRLSFSAVGTIGMAALPAIVLCIGSALLLVPWLGHRIGVSQRLSTLIAVGTSICGVSAIMATAPAIAANDDEVSYAVACVALFGLVAMLVYPVAAPFLVGHDPRSIGIFLGTAIHDTTQVAGAALAYQQQHNAPEVLNTATVVKIVRNLGMVVVIPLMAGSFRRVEHGRPESFRPRQQVLPLFVFGFLAMTLVRTLGDATPLAFGFLSSSDWQGLLQLASRVSTALLTVVMAAVGLSTGVAQLKRLGLRPFLIGLAAALVVGVVSLGTLTLLSALG